jgi:Flp pilus assembly protein TadD
MNPLKKSSSSARVSGILLILLMCNLDLWAQTLEPQRRGRDTTFFLEGTVIDESQNPIPHARVKLGLLHSPGVRQGHTNSDGRFIFQTLTEGSYMLEVQAAGFETKGEEISILSTSRNVRLVLRSSSQQQTPSDGPPRAVSASELQVPAKARKLYQKGLESHQRKAYPEALKHFENARKVHPPFAAAFAAEGITYLQLNERDKARAAFEESLHFDPENFDAHLGIGLVYNDLRRFEDSQTHLLKARTIASQGWQVHFELGRSCSGLGRYQEAEACFEQARTLKPSYPRLYLLLADALLRQDKLADALPVMETYLELEPDGAAAERVRARIVAIQNLNPASR